MSLGEWSVVQLCQQNRQGGKFHTGTNYWVPALWQITWKCIPGVSLVLNWEQTNKAFIPLNFSILSPSGVLSRASDKGGSWGSSHLRSTSNSKGTGKPWGESDFWALFCLWFILQLHFQWCRWELPAPTSKTQILRGLPTPEDELEWLKSQCWWRLRLLECCHCLVCVIDFIPLVLPWHSLNCAMKQLKNSSGGRNSLLSHILMFFCCLFVFYLFVLIFLEDNSRKFPVLWMDQEYLITRLSCLPLIGQVSKGSWYLLTWWAFKHS